MDDFREPEQLMSSKSRLNYRGLCLKKCKNRDKKCFECCKIQGKETEYIPEGGESNAGDNEKAESGKD